MEAISKPMDELAPTPIQAVPFDSERPTEFRLEAGVWLQQVDG